MITINYQTFGNKGFQLRLRLYRNGETKFINVTKLLLEHRTEHPYILKYKMRLFTCFFDRCSLPLQANLEGVCF